MEAIDRHFKRAQSFVQFNVVAILYWATQHDDEMHQLG